MNDPSSVPDSATPSFDEIFPGPLIADRLIESWAEVEAGKIERKEFVDLEKALLDSYASEWSRALKLDLSPSLRDSLIGELREFFMPHASSSEVISRCQGAVAQMRDEWNDSVDMQDRESITSYYDSSQSYPFELTWWHSLGEDLSPLAYVAALHLALQHEGRDLLDFGCGVGSGGLLFSGRGFRCTAADISSTMLNFTAARFSARGIPLELIDLKERQLPEAAYDFVTAMDVLEHVPDPAETLSSLAPAIREGGILFGRFAADIDPERPSHIATDFEPAFKLLDDLGFKLIWEDRWFWGHRAYQKTK